MGLVLAVRTPVIVPTVARLAASPIYRCITPAIGSTTDATVEVAAELRDRLVSRLKRFACAVAVCRAGWLASAIPIWE